MQPAVVSSFPSRGPGGMARGAQLATVGGVKPSIRCVAQFHDVVQFDRCGDLAALVAVGAERVGFQERETKPAPRVVITSVVRCAAVSIVCLGCRSCVTLRWLVNWRTGWHLLSDTTLRLYCPCVRDFPEMPAYPATKRLIVAN